MNIDWSKNRAELADEYAGGRACSTRQTLFSVRREAMQATLQYLSAGSSANMITPSLFAALAGPALRPKGTKSKMSRKKTRNELELLEKLYAEARYPSSEAKDAVCRETSLTSEQIKHWLYRRRQRDLRDSASMTSSASQTYETPPPTPGSEPAAPSVASTYYLLHHICGQTPPASPSSDSVSSVGSFHSA